MKKHVVGLLLAVGLGACTQPANTMYQWGGYQQALLNYYKDPSAKTQLVDDLGLAVQQAEAEDAVPPGLYAEYGFALLELGENQDAIAFFEKEADLWPESRPFLLGLVARISPPDQEGDPEDESAMTAAADTAMSADNDTSSEN